ncbi:MAG: hypothetical protein WC780_11725 [Lentimicrobiaceae bacterium]
MKNFLIPYTWKLFGLFLTVSGIISAVFYLWFDFRFTLPVFAVFSSFLETKMFTTFRTNFADDLILLLLISGLALIVFSKEKIESENLNSFRARALVKALIVNNLFLFLSILFVFGTGFIAILVINLFSFSIFYLIFYYIMKQKEKDRFNLNK